jgi:hypothetical protein
MTLTAGAGSGTGADGVHAFKVGSTEVARIDYPSGVRRLLFDGGAAQIDASSSLALRQGVTERIKLDGTGLGFFGATPIAQPAVTGARDDTEAALANLLTALDSLGLIDDQSTAT